MQADCRVVLVVDDEPVILMGTVSLIKSLGFGTLQAKSGLEAIALLEARADICAVVTDYSMPGCSGLDLAAAAQRLRPGIPVLLTTGHTNINPADGDKWMRIYKPFTRDELAIALGTALSR